ncbi:lipopolysaccharide biosynthesis protein [Roseospira marina]|nr:lipopolysaccharide biosynthesis protein [Roseospira marina]MBB4315851.1 O-antigen/teichoic acid export membrane protein [Roseospira marina]MBB5089009.1 O-antigen/teichoic acid export membrane protein [Roseospira marina]
MGPESQKSRGLGPVRSAWLFDDRLKKLFANAGILLGGKGLNAVFSLAAMAVAARALGTEAFGVLILIHAFIQTMGDIAKFQSWQAVLRYGTGPVMEGQVETVQRLLRFTVVLDGLGAVLGIGLAMALSWWVGPHLGWSDDLQPGVMVYATSILFMVSATPTGVLRLVDRFDLLSVQSTLGSVVRLAAGLVAWGMDAGTGGFLVAWYLGTTVAGLSLFYAAWREVKGRGLLDGFRWWGGPWTADFPRIWSFVWSTNLNASLGLISNHLSTLAVGGLLGPSDAALFRVARQVGTALSKPAKLLVPAIYPELAKLSTEGAIQTMRSLVGRAALLAGAGASLSLLVAWLGGEWLLGLVLGPDFVAAYPVMLWLVAAGVVSIAAFPLEPVLISGGEAGTALRARLWSSALYIPVLLLLVHQFGLIGAGWARLFATVITLIAFLLPVLRWFRARVA